MRAGGLEGKPLNARCAECTHGQAPWVSLDYGIFLCTQCAAAHRSLGSHISKVRSTELDHFSEHEIAWVNSLGNEKSNSIWEAALPNDISRPSHSQDCPDCVRRIWLRYKYDEQSFVAGSKPLKSMHRNADGFLHVLGSFIPIWKRRFFRVCDRELRYYSDETCTSEKGRLGLDGVSVFADEHSCLVLKIFAMSADRGNKPSLVVRAVKQKDAERWAWIIYQNSRRGEGGKEVVERLSRT